MKVVAVVPIKLNNERLKNKNIKKFDNGEPLCTYLLNTLKKVKKIDEIYVYCSNETIKDYIPDGIKFLKRSENLDSSTTKMNEILQSFANKVDSDLYVLAHVTAPFITESSISDGIEHVLSGEYDSSFSVQLLQEFLWKNGEPLNYNLSAIPRTQDLPFIYSETSGFYVYSKQTILELNRRIGNNPYLKVVSKVEAIDIDEADNFEIANAIYNFRRRKNG